MKLFIKSLMRSGWTTTCEKQDVWTTPDNLKLNTTRYILVLNVPPWKHMVDYQLLMGFTVSNIFLFNYQVTNDSSQHLLMIVAKFCRLRLGTWDYSADDPDTASGRLEYRLEAVDGAEGPRLPSEWRMHRVQFSQVGNGRAVGGVQSQCSSVGGGRLWGLPVQVQHRPEVAVATCVLQHTHLLLKIL